MAEVIPQITVDSSKVKNTWVQNEVVTNDVYNAINKAVIDLKNNNNLLDTNAILFREQYNSSSKNLNNAIHQGIYSFTSSAVNAPSGVTGGNLFVTNTSKINQGSSVITQIAFCHNGAVYARTKNNSENFTSWNKLAYITDNVASATKATQDKKGRDITGYLYKTEDLVLNSSADIVTTGNITEILNSFCTKFKNIQGTSSYAENPPTTLKSLNDNKAPKASPTFSGTPTSPTPATSDNSTRIATTAFVNSYAPSKSGSGASGTWGINISGTAAKATKDSQGNTINTHYLSRNQNINNDMNACTVEGIYRFSGDLKNAWTSTSRGTLLVFNNNYNGGSGTGGTYLFQMAFPTDGTIRTRQRVNTQTWTSWFKVAYITDNVASATKATQDKKGRDITGYLYKTEDLVLNSSADIVTTGNITEILNSFCTKFKNIQGTSSYAENPPTSIKSLNDKFANYLPLNGGTMKGTIIMGTGTEIQIKAPNNTGFYFNSGSLGFYDWNATTGGGVFSYSPSSNTFNIGKKVTAPTPATSDNSTRIATTAFVKSLFTASKTTNGWHKEASTGLIWQWGTVQGVGGGKLYNFPISFPNAVLGCASNRATRSSSGAVDGNSAGIVINNKSSFYAYDDDGSNNVNYIAVGY